MSQPTTATLLDPQPPTADPVAVASLTRQLAAANARIADLSAQLHRRRPKAGKKLRRRLVDNMIDLVNDQAINLDGANQLLASLDLPTLHGPRDVTFTVPAAVGAEYEGPAATIKNALELIRWELRPASHTHFVGCPGGYAFDQPGPPEPPNGERYVTVHTELQLTVTVRAFKAGTLDATARRLLDADLPDPDSGIRLRTDAITDHDDDNPDDGGGEDPADRREDDDRRGTYRDFEGLLPLDLDEL